MKVLAFNSSPNKEKGNTALILTPFLKGLEDAGAQIDLHYTQNMKINPCQGDFTCIMKTPGKCVQQDDMQQLYPKLREAHIIVFASPLYFDGITASMKNLIERLWVPCGTPFLELRNGHTRHPNTNSAEEKKTKVVLVSNCGFWEIENFNPMIEHVKAICENINLEFAGALLRPHGPTLRMMLKMDIPVQDVLDAAKAAGRQLGLEGKISQQTLRIVSRELVPQEQYVKGHNQRIQQFLEMMKTSSTEMAKINNSTTPPFPKAK
jgi:multimeric flavodoxin WrbA